MTIILIFISILILGLILRPYIIGFIRFKANPAEFGVVYLQQRLSKEYGIHDISIKYLTLQAELSYAYSQLQTREKYLDILKFKKDMIAASYSDPTDDFVKSTVEEMIDMGFDPASRKWRSN